MKIFILLPRVPWPLEKGDKLRAFNQLRFLSKANEIHLCCLNDIRIYPDAEKILQEHCKTIHILPLPFFGRMINIVRAFFNGTPLQAGYFYSKKNQREINRIIAQVKPDRIYCQLVRVAAYVKDQNIKKVIDYQDVFSKGAERRISSAPFYMKPVLRSEYKRLLRYENKVFGQFDERTIISLPDRELIPHPERNKIHVIPNGVDQEYYVPHESEKKYDLIFTGNMGYPPNVNCAEVLVKNIMPIVWQQLPETTLMLAGANPSSSVLALASPKVSVSGWVKDMREYYSSAKIFIAPMQIGTGLQNKLLEAMIMKLPCITSVLANSALQAKDGTEILTAESFHDFARHITVLLNDIKKATLLAEQGYQFVIKNYRWEVVNDRLQQVICS